MALDRLTIITSSGLSTVSDYVIDGLRAVGVVTASTVQVGAATTVHTTGVDLGSGNITSHNINSTGIITATGVTVTGDLTVEGTLAYDDVTNIDSVGLGTFRNGLHVTGGSIGIGTDNTTTTGFSRTLRIKGSSTSSGVSGLFADSYNGSAWFGFYSGSSTSDTPALLYPFNGALRIGTTNSVGTSGFAEKLRITSAGDMGLGTATPTSFGPTFQVAGTDPALLLQDTATAVDYFGANVTSGIAQLWYDDAAAFTINTATAISGSGLAERLRITSAGNLGINNASPGTKLAIGDGTIDSSNVITFGKRVAGTNSNLPVIGHHSDGSGSGIAICATSSGGKIHFFTGNGSAGFGDGSNAERMRIDHNGNVCIGDNLTPNRLLHLKAASSTAYSGGSDTADYNFLKIENTTDDKSAGIFFAIGSNGEAAITATEVVDGNTDIAFQNRGGGVRSEKLRLDSQGRLGVGVIPKAFHANNKDVIQGSSGYVILGRGTSSLNISQNFYYDSSDAGKYIATGAATVYNQSNGSHTFYNASSGSADGSASLVERFQIQSDGRVSIGAPAANALGALHIHANQGTDTALWVGDSSTNRYLAINEQGSTQNFNHIHTRFNDNAIHAHYILDNPYAAATGYGSQILFRGYNQGTSAYLETSNEAANSARATFRIRGRDNHGLDVRSTGEVTTTHASNIGYATNAATNTRSLVYQSRDPQRQEPVASDWYILKSFWPSKSGTVNMHAEMYIQSGPYYFSFRVREEGTNTIVFNAGDNGGFGSYATNGNSVHSYRIYKWVCPLIKAHKRYYIEMAATNAAGTAGPYTSVGQWLYLKNFSVYSMSPGHSDGTEAIQIGQPQDVSSAQSYSGTTHFYMSPGVNRDSINVTQYFSGTESTFLGWFTTRAYNRYIDFELNMSGSYMWFAQAYGYLYSRGQVAGSMISGYTYTNNQILNKYSVTLGNRGWYGSYRTSGGNLCLKFDSGGNGYSEGRIALFLGTHGPTNPEWRVLQYRQNDTTNNIF